MKAQHIITWAVAALAGFGGWAEAGDPGYGGTRPQTHHNSQAIGVTSGVPLFFYTGRKYSSSMYGSPGRGGYYFGSRYTSRKYYRYQANPWYTDRLYYRYQLAGSSPATKSVQAALAQHGYYRGAIDGVAGPMTQSAIWQFQDAHGLRRTGTIDDALLRALRVQ